MSAADLFIADSSRNPALPQIANSSSRLFAIVPFGKASAKTLDHLAANAQGYLVAEPIGEMFLCEIRNTVPEVIDMQDAPAQSTIPQPFHSQPGQNHGSSILSPMSCGRTPLKCRGDRRK